MNKKKWSKKKKIIVISIILLIVIAAGAISTYLYIKNKKKAELPVKVVEVLDSIEGYGYHLEDRDTALYKEKFLELKEVLEAEEIDYEKYANLLSELFAIDLYTIDNKNSKYDVGSLDFIYPEEQEKFQNKLIDSMYKMVEDNSTNNRKQELPIVSNVEIINTKEVKYTKGETKLEGYELNLTLSYEQDLGYDTDVIVTVVKEENKLYVVSLTTNEQ